MTPADHRIAALEEAAQIAESACGEFGPVPQWTLTLVAKRIREAMALHSAVSA